MAACALLVCNNDEQKTKNEKKSFFNFDTICAPIQELLMFYRVVIIIHVIAAKAWGISP